MSDQTPAISIRGLTKRYGRTPAVEDLTLEVRPGEIYGLLGLNGAGKTTTIRILLDLVRPTCGAAFVFGRHCRSESLAVRAAIGFLPGEITYYGDMTGRQVLDLLDGLGRRRVQPDYQRRLLERFALTPGDLDRRLREYSTGMKRKLGLVQAFQSDPLLLILDEPTEGLDPLMQQAVYEALAEVRGRGRTIFMSSHVLPEVGRVCDRIGVLREGRLVLAAPVDEVRRLAPRHVRVSFAADVEAPAQAWPPGVELADFAGRSWSLSVRGPLGPLLQRLATLPVADLQVDESRLEEVVIGYYRGTDAGSSAEDRHFPPALPVIGAPRRFPLGPWKKKGVRESPPRHPTLTLLRHSIGRVRGLAAAMAVVLAAFQVLLVRVAGGLQVSAGFSGLGAFVPPFVRQMAGESLFTFMSFPGIVCLGYFHPAIIAALSGMVVAAATEPAAEVETRFLDAVLVRPVPRLSIIARSAGVLMLLPAAVLIAMIAGTAAGLHWLAPSGVQPPGVRLIASLAANLWALLVCVGGWALALGAASRRRSTAGAIAGIATLALFLLEYLARAWEPAKAIAWLSPFDYFKPMELLRGRPLEASHIATLLIAGAAGVAVAAVVFSRRDL